MPTTRNEPIDVASGDGVTTITMTYEPYNLMGPTLLQPLLTAMEYAAASGERAILLRSGLRHFSAGADVDQFQRSGADDGDPPTTPAEILGRLARIPIPIVVAVHGVCLGGGLELALVCDYIVAARSAKVGSVEVALGMHPLMGAIQRVAQRAGEARAKEMAMLGRRYDPATLERWNVINLVAPDDELDQVAFTVAAELAAGPTVAHAATKQLVEIAVDEGVQAADEAMRHVQKPIFESNDLREGLRSFQKNGPGMARFEGR